MIQETGVLDSDRSNRYRILYQNDVVYAHRQKRDLLMQLLMPENPMLLQRRGLPLSGRHYPAIVYARGSGWRGSSSTAEIAQLVDFARRGYIVASIEYQGTERDGVSYPAHVQDCKEAVRFLRANAENFGIDTDRIAIVGDSSGAHCAAMVGATEGEPEFEFGENLEYSSAVCAVVDIYGPVDIEHIAADTAALKLPPSHWPPASELLFGDDADWESKLKHASVINHISREKPLCPYLVMHGDCDKTVPITQSERFVTQLRELGKRVEYYRVVGADHDEGFWTKPVIDTICDFLDSIMAKRL